MKGLHRRRNDLRHTHTYKKRKRRRSRTLRSGIRFYLPRALASRQMQLCQFLQMLQSTESLGVWTRRIFHSKEERFAGAGLSEFIPFPHQVDPSYFSFFFSFPRVAIDNYGKERFPKRTSHCADANRTFEMLKRKLNRVSGLFDPTFRCGGVCFACGRVCKPRLSGAEDWGNCSRPEKKEASARKRICWHLHSACFFFLTAFTRVLSEGKNRRSFRQSVLWFHDGTEVKWANQHIETFEWLLSHQPSVFVISRFANLCADNQKRKKWIQKEATSAILLRRIPSSFSWIIPFTEK